MPRGAPDYSNVRAATPLHRLDDMAELAARLGSPVTHNRQGNVVYIETFRNGFGSWNISGSGNGTEAIISAQNCRSDGYSAKLTAGDADGNTAKIFRKFAMPVLGRYGLEFSVKIESGTKDFLWTLAYHDGTDEHNYTMKYSLENEQLLIKTSPTAYAVIESDIPLVFLYSPFHTIKMVVDLPNDEFVSLIINETPYDIAGRDNYVFETPDSPNVRVDLQQRGAGGGNPSSWVDDVILTQNEP